MTKTTSPPIHTATQQRVYDNLFDIEFHEGVGWVLWALDGDGKWYPYGPHPTREHAEWERDDMYYASAGWYAGWAENN